MLKQSECITILSNHITSTDYPIRIAETGFLSVGHDYNKTLPLLQNEKDNPENLRRNRVDGTQTLLLVSTCSSKCLPLHFLSYDSSITGVTFIITNQNTLF